MGYRVLTKQEIDALHQQGCRADSWADITVKDGFRTDHVRNITFSGKIRLGVFDENIEAEKGIYRPAGLNNSKINQCDIGDNVYISDTGLVSNYIIEDHVVINNTGSVAVHQVTSFGNGTEVEVLNETGGRELVIFDRLSSQLAYILAFYRHDQQFTERLKSMIHAYVSTKKSDTGRIGAYSKIQYAGVLKNVSLGNHTVISGAKLMEECSVVGNEPAPVYIGEGVIVKKSIILSGSVVTDHAYIDKCLVGQSVSIGRQFSAENSVFFANTEAGLGEAGSLFAGPYTVTHHKATLLLAGMFSFYNAGSGTNISNHMYKLGPLHQGIVERGSKTGSSSYLLWPCRVGAYSVVVGKHLANFDTSDFPFSYIAEENRKSILYPAMNLFTVGTRRDSEKWPSRDKRKDPEKIDLINFNLFNPYIAGKMVNAIGLLGELAEKAQKTQEYVSYKGIQISRLLLKTTRKFYEMALKVYFGNEIVNRLEAIAVDLSMTRIREALAEQGEQGLGAWRDLSGMIAPADAIDALTENVSTGKLKSVEQVLDQLKDVHESYAQHAWNWCSAHIKKETGSETWPSSRETLIQIITDWKINAVKLDNMILQDATKEFDLTSRYGYGIDGDEEINTLDFEAVRGTYEGNKFVKGLKTEIETIEDRASKLITRLQSLS